MAAESTGVLAALVAQAGPAEQPWIVGQALPFLVAGLVILAVVVWAAAGGLRRRRQAP